jgi:hypothetical protein
MTFAYQATLDLQQLQPGWIYAINDLTVPDAIKIGKAGNVQSRRNGHQTICAEFVVVEARFKFMQVFKVETALKRYFAEQGKRVPGCTEHFYITLPEFVEAIKVCQAAEVALRKQIEQAASLLQAEDQCTLVSLDHTYPYSVRLLLDTALRGAQNMSVKDAWEHVVTDSRSFELYAREFKKLGLVAMLSEGVLLFDFEPNTRLNNVFLKTPCSESWRKELTRFAGIDRNMRLVTKAKWGKTAGIEPEKKAA